MDEEKILKEFDDFSRAKKIGAINSKLIIAFSLIVIISVLIWAYSISVSAYNKIIVVDSQGGFLQTTAESREKLFITLAKTTCSNLIHYANSFERLTITENQAKAMFYCNREDMLTVFNFYDDKKAYHVALESGAVYKAEIENIKKIGVVEPYEVEFTSILTVVNMHRETKYRIYSSGLLIEIASQFPENNTGLFFSNYKQTLVEIE